MKEVLKEVKKVEYLEYIDSITKELSLMGNDGGELGFRVSGSSGEWNVSRRIKEEMLRIGLTDVRTDEFPVHSWEFLSGRLVLQGTGREETFVMSSFCGIKGTAPEGVTAEIIDVGSGTKTDYIGKSVAGKIVLFTIDILDDFWHSLPVYQAELRGAVGCVLTYKGNRYGTRDDALNSFDSQCKYGLPVGNISRKDAAALRTMLAEGPVTATLKLDIKVDLNGKSSNVYGIIPGKNKDKYVMLGGHMDGYFHSYQDDLLGVGTVLGIAKAVLQSGYQPEHSMIIMSHGSEEYGVTESRYDWCIGSWYSINKLRPDWQGKIKAFLNIDAVRPGTPVYVVNATQELHEFFGEIFENITVPADCWPGGQRLAGINGPWSDDYNYAVGGVPAVICGRGPADWSYRNYHTQFDDYTIFESEKGIMQFVLENYTELALKLDECILPPFSFKNVTDQLTATFEDLPVAQASAEIDELKQVAAATGEVAAAVYSKIVTYNKAYRDAIAVGTPADRLDGTHDALMSAYKLIQRDLMKLSPWDDVVFAHECIGGNILALEKAQADAETAEMDNAFAGLRDVDLFRVALDFDPEVFSWLMSLQDPSRDDLYWGTGKVHPMIRADLLLNDIEKSRQEHDYGAIVQRLGETLSEEISLYKKTIRDETAVLTKLKSILEAVSFE
ncbi:MAG: M28 family peptidase [Clostridiales Family XIII bacterium]|jgi:hypothetical protein|nr:M28 family peptidase [Clostridiales Family XIII bacterium]